MNQTLVVVAGPPRSGSSCVAGIVHHLGVSMGGPFLREADKTYEDADLATYMDNLKRTTKDERAAWLDDWMARDTSPIRGIKYHTLCFMLPELAKLWPQVKVIGTNRPTAEVMESRRRMGWRKTSPEEHCRSRDAAVCGLGLPALQLQYHDILSHPQAAVRQIVDFLGLSPTAEQYRNALLHIRSTENLPNIAWTYWEGIMPAWIDLCFATMRRNIPGINILTPSTLSRLYAAHRTPDEPYDMLAEAPALLRPCQRSNIIRAWLLRTFGGLWVDADCLVLSDLRDLCQRYGEGKDLVTYKYKKKFSVDAMMMSRPDGEIISEYARTQNDIVKAHRGRQRIRNRLALGPPRLRDAIVSAGIDKVGIVPTELVDPALGGRKHDYLAAGDLPPGCACVMLRAGTGKGKEAWTKDQWLNDSWLAGLFQRALES